MCVQASSLERSLSASSRRVVVRVAMRGSAPGTGPVYEHAAKPQPPTPLSAQHNGTPGAVTLVCRCVNTRGPLARTAAKHAEKRLDTSIGARAAVVEVGAPTDGRASARDR